MPRARRARRDYRMPLTRRRRIAVAAACALAAAAAAAGTMLAAQGGGAGPAPARAAASAGVAQAAPARTAAPRPAKAPLSPLTVVSKLPAWRAPGGRLVVEGRTAPRARVVLLVAGRRIGAAGAGPLGRYVVEGRVPSRAGRVAVAVASGGRKAAAGALRIRPVSLAAVGDVTFGATVGWRVERQGVRYPWLGVAKVLSGADIATANLEGAVSARGSAEPNKLFTFRGPVAAVRAANAFAGIDLWTLANNHSRDFGALALLDTIKAARKGGAATVGAGRDLASARSAAVLERGGLRIAFLGYNDVPPWNFTAQPGYAGTAPAVASDIARDVRVARSRADVVVVWFHWGYELEPRPNGRQEELARAALDAGAALVLGAHPHVLLPVTQPQPNRLVAWSLGNFVFTPRSAVTGRTAILHVQLGAGGVLGHRLQGVQIAAEQPRFAPGAFWITGGGANAAPPDVPYIVPPLNSEPNPALVPGASAAPASGA